MPRPRRTAGPHRDDSRVWSSRNLYPRKRCRCIRKPPVAVWHLRHAGKDPWLPTTRASRRPARCPPSRCSVPTRTGRYRQLVEVRAPAATIANHSMIPPRTSSANLGGHPALGQSDAARIVDPVHRAVFPADATARLHLARRVDDLAGVAPKCSTSGHGRSAASSIPMRETVSTIPEEATTRTAHLIDHLGPKGSTYSPMAPSMASRRRSAWPTCRAYSSIRCSRMNRTSLSPNSGLCTRRETSSVTFANTFRDSSHAAR